MEEVRQALRNVMDVVCRIGLDGQSFFYVGRGMRKWYSELGGEYMWQWYNPTVIVNDEE